ncbi:MAG: hypothetical protein NTW74_16205 [Acidobacteria bacterium]|nr:hypothetical protein [Acidobacteriota bacterium]
MRIAEHSQRSKRVSRWAALSCGLLLLAGVGLAQGIKPPYELGTEDIAVYNYVFENPKPIFVAEYALDTFGVDSSGYAFRMIQIRRIETGDMVTWPKQKAKSGYERILVAVPTESMLWDTFGKGSTTWDSRTKINIGALGKVYVTDRGGNFDAINAINYNAGEWWGNLWDKLTPAGSTVTINNHSTSRWYVGEYQKKALGKLSLLKTIGWVEPGTIKTFTRSNMSLGYTERHIRWIDSTSLPSEISHDSFQSFKGRQDVGVPINIAHIDVDKDGVTKGFTTLEWEAKLLVDRIVCRAFSGLATAFEAPNFPPEVQIFLEAAIAALKPIEDTILQAFPLQQIADKAAQTMNGKFDSTQLDAVQKLVDVLDASSTDFDTAVSADNLCGLQDSVVPPGTVDKVLLALGANPLPASMETGAFISYGKTSTFKYKNFNFQVLQSKAVMAKDLRNLNQDPQITRFIKISGGVSTTSGFGGLKAKEFTYYLPGGSVSSLYTGGSVGISLTGAPKPLDKIGVNLMFDTNASMEGFGFSANKKAAGALSGTFLGGFAIRLKDKD